VSEMRTEEEQVEALKNWWNENGKSLVVAIAIALSAVFGWKAWQQKQANDAEAASIAYQNLVDAVSESIGGSPDQFATSQHLASGLKQDHAGTEYARFAALLMARLLVDQEKYDQAILELDWVLASEPTQEMASIAMMRKARVLYAMNEHAKGIELLKGINEAEFSAGLFELQGDLLLASGKNDEARVSYQKALDASKNGSANPLLQIKFEDLVTAEEG